MSHSSPTSRRILIIGDSNCLARRDGKYRDSWVCLLKQSLPGDDFIVLADGSRTSEYLALNPIVRPDGTSSYDPSSLEMFDPAVVILNLGIVDCAPRLFTRNEARALGILPGPLREILIATARRLRPRSDRRVYVRPEAFEENVRQYLARCAAAGVSRVVLVGIPTPDERGVSRNPRIRENVGSYNDILARLAGSHPGVLFVDPLHPREAVSELYVEDGYHLSVRGHAVVFEALAAALAQPAP